MAAPFGAAVLLALGIAALDNANTFGSGVIYGLAGFCAAALVLIGTPFAFGLRLRMQGSFALSSSPPQPLVVLEPPEPVFVLAPAVASADAPHPEPPRSFPLNKRSLVATAVTVVAIAGATGGGRAVFAEAHVAAVSQER
jgi:hypothetical protein